MEEPLRLRVVFDDQKMLDKSQRSEGLKHCWILLNPSIATISDLESHVRKTFHLKRSCPNGIVFCMNDFVLPPFESTCVLKDQDIIRVRKKDVKGVDAMAFGDDPHPIQDSGVLDAKHIIDSEKLLAITQFGEDSDQHMRKTDNGIYVYDKNVIHMGSPSKAPSKSKNKRKHSDGVRAPKMNKLKSSSMKSDITGEDDENIQNTDEAVDIGFEKCLGSSQKIGRSRGNTSLSDKPSTIDRRHGISAQLENNIEQVTGSVQREKINARAEENIGGNTCEPHVNGSVTKVQSRNARRKKQRREWMREMRPLWRKNIQNQSPTAIHEESSKKVQSRNARRKKQRREWMREMRPLWRKNIQNQCPPTTIHEESSKKEETEQNTEMEKESVPVVISPGHIRIQPSDEEQSPWQSQEAMETLQLNGTTSNNKDQNNVSKWNDSKGFKEQFNGNEKIARQWTDANGNRGPKCFRENSWSKWNDGKGYRGQKCAWANNWNDANGYRGRKWAREDNGSKWNDANCFKEHTANCCKEQSNGKQKAVSTWNDSNGYKEQYSSSPARRMDANDYRRHKWVKEIAGSKWNNSSGYNEQSIGKQKTIRTWNSANCYKEQGNVKADKWGDANGYEGQKWVGEDGGSKWNDGDVNGYRGEKLVRENMQSKFNVTNWYKEQSNGKEILGKRWTDANGYEDQWVPFTSNIWDPADGNKELNNSVSVSLKVKTGSSPFGSLFPLTRIPQVGDVLAYRLIELSPSWHPEVSSFRVGEVASYNYLSMNIMLVPVPEFPIFSDEDVKRTDPMHGTKPSPYNKDGSLLIHYPSLADVRLLRASDSGATSSDCSEREMSTQAAAPVNKWDLAIANTNAKEMVFQPKENGNAGRSTCNQIKQKLNEEKAQLQRQNGWDEWSPNKRNDATCWSYQAMRGGGIMGPNLANIRGGQNHKYQYRKQVRVWY